MSEERLDDLKSKDMSLDDLKDSLAALNKLNERTMRTLVHHEYGRVIELIQCVNFEEKLDEGQRRVLKKIMDFCIERKKAYA